MTLIDRVLKMFRGAAAAGELSAETLRKFQQVEALQRPLTQEDRIKAAQQFSELLQQYFAANPARAAEWRAAGLPSVTRQPIRRSRQGL